MKNIAATADISRSSRHLALTPTDRRAAGMTGPVGKEGQRCSIKGCKKQHLAKGLCATHYRRVERGEDITAKIVSGASLVGCFTRVSVDRMKVLRQQAKLLGFDSCYQLASQILETWIPQAKPSKRARKAPTKAKGAEARLNNPTLRQRSESSQRPETISELQAVD